MIIKTKVLLGKLSLFRQIMPSLEGTISEISEYNIQGFPLIYQGMIRNRLNPWGLRLNNLSDVQ
jgi:hypothetical protein